MIVAAVRGEIPHPLWGGGPLLPFGEEEKGALPVGKGPWRRATRGWLDLGQVRPPRVGAAGCSPVELACLACKLASKPHR